MRMSTSGYGSLKVFAGPMFSGKTTQLIALARNAGTDFVALRCELDDRYSDNSLVTHDGTRLPAYTLRSRAEFLQHSASVPMIIVDEVQFFTKPHYQSDFVEEVRELLAQGKDIVCAGLDLDFRGRPFETTAMLLAMADNVEKLKARCSITGLPASKTLKLNNQESRVEIGGRELYQPRANSAWGSPE